MIIVDEYYIHDFTSDQFEAFGKYYGIQIYKHFHNPLITIFDQGLRLTVVTFELEEFESLVTLDRLLPIYARDVYKKINDTIYPSQII